ncbi:unnamed protein product [Nezara viridula]|uniref:Uncharacterized protein n=1 Tax=Nezara viridula TaxID=85310 RepID=A0A9P0H922_NEZVI|nr:unnamed protein product [Nezara viridula]
MNLLVVNCIGCIDTLQEICRVPSYTAVFPFRFKEDRVFLCRWRLFFSIIAFAILTYQAGMLIIRPSNSHIASPLIYLAYCVEQMSVKIALFIGLFCTTWYHRSWKQMVLYLHQVERTLRENGVLWTYRIIYPVDAIYIVFIITVMFQHAIIRSKTWYTFSKVITYYSSMLMLFIVTVQFKRLVIFICSGFKLIQNVLCNTAVNPLNPFHQFSHLDREHLLCLRIAWKECQLQFFREYHKILMVDLVFIILSDNRTPLYYN